MGVAVLELGVLGPVRAVRDGRELGLGGPNQRAVLALLLVDAGRMVPAEYLAEALWRGSPPPGAGKTMRSYVSRLRSLLGPEPALGAITRSGRVHDISFTLSLPPILLTSVLALSRGSTPPRRKVPCA